MIIIYVLITEFICCVEQIWSNEDVGIGPKIPQALEKILQQKEIRQEQLIIAPTGQIWCNKHTFYTEVWKIV